MISPVLTRRTLLAGSAGAGAAMLLGCGNDTTPDTPTLHRGEVTVTTSFGHLGRDAYLHLTAAEFAGDLTVVVEPGQGTSANLVALTGAAAEFAASDIMGMLVAHGSQDGGAGAVLLAAVQQQTIAGLMTTHPGIRQPQDLHGRTIGLPPGAGSELLFEPWAIQAGVDASRVEIEPVGAPDLVPALLSGRVDAIGQFVVGLPFVQAGVRGAEVTVLAYSDYLTDTYGVGLWTTRALADSDPDLCRLWRDSTLAGLQAALDDPEHAASTLADMVPETNTEAASEELRLMRPYTAPPDPRMDLGAVDVMRLERAIALLMSTGAIPDVIDPAEIVIPGLTLGVEA